MNARDLPGYGDAATFGFRAPLEDNEPTGSDMTEACDEVAEWLDTIEVAYKAALKNPAQSQAHLERARQAADAAIDILKSIHGNMQ